LIDGEKESSRTNNKEAISSIVLGNFVTTVLGWPVRGTDGSRRLLQVPSTTVDSTIVYNGDEVDSAQAFVVEVVSAVNPFPSPFPV
jgi:hypothetical protein